MMRTFRTPSLSGKAVPFLGAAALSLGILSLGCASQQTKSTVDAAGSSAPGATPSEDNEAGPKGPAADVLYASHEAVPKAPAHCVLAESLPPPAGCKDARDALAEALLLEGAPRDAALAALEACQDFPVGLLRALRAEMGAPECADQLVVQVVGEGTKSSNIPGDIRETLVALGLGARLVRLAVDPPEAPEDRSKASLESYFEKDLFPWISRQAQAIFVMSSQGTRLSGYARGVVAIEAGNADMRFVEIAREAPLAKEIQEHEEARDLYYATLDEQLEPRKARGRNAALVGLREMAQLGVRTSERVTKARRLLSSVYGGRRVNALDTLLLPILPPEKAEGAPASIASRVPTSYVTSLAGQATATPQLVRAHMQMGMPVSLRREVEASGAPLSRYLLARAIFESGRTYFRAEDFQAVQALLAPLLDEAPGTDPGLTKDQIEDAMLLRALAVALLAGPKDAADLIANGPRFADSLGNLALLDGLAEQKGVLGGRAAFNAAYLRELVAPEGAPDYWADLSSRYAKAGAKLTGSEKKISQERALACKEIERALRKPRS